MLLRDKEETDEVVVDRLDYKKQLGVTLHIKLGLLSALNTKEDKVAVYALLSDIHELVNCLGGYYLTAKTDVASVARHEAFAKVNKERAEELGGYFNGKVA